MKIKSWLLPVQWRGPAYPLTLPPSVVLRAFAARSWWMRVPVGERVDVAWARVECIRYEDQEL